MMVTEDFKKVAVSFAGGDGGNPNSDVWFCGLEWGIGDGTSLDNFYEKFSLSPKLIPHSWLEDDFDESLMEEGFNFYNEESIAFCGLDDFEAFLKAYHKFMKTYH